MAFGNSLLSAPLFGLEEIARELQFFGAYLLRIPYTAAACRFDGTVVAPVFSAAYGIKAIAKTGTGQYTLTFVDTYPGLRYGVQISCAGATMLVGQATVKTETTATIQLQTLAGAAADSADCFVSVILIPA
jgi:hypothetical protein